MERREKQARHTRRRWALLGRENRLGRKPRANNRHFRDMPETLCATSYDVEHSFSRGPAYSYASKELQVLERFWIEGKRINPCLLATPTPFLPFSRSRGKAQKRGIPR